MELAVVVVRAGAAEIYCGMALKEHLVILMGSTLDPVVVTGDNGLAIDHG